MADERKDWLSVCNNMGVPEADFKATFCDRCVQTECTRSLSSDTKFEGRVSTWYERLFTNPATLDSNDPRYSQIRAKRFLEIAKDPIPEIGILASPPSSWVDPRDLEPEKEAPVPDPEPDTVAISQPEAPPPPASEAKPEETAPEAEPDSEGVRLLNTPEKKGQTLGNRKLVKKEVADSWEAPKRTETEGVPVVSPGAKFRFGDPK